jgi:isopentenyldiphosphate isomerase
MEICDLYNKNGIKLNKTHIRGVGNPIEQDEYTLAVDVWIKDDKNQILLTQRHPLKKYYPMKWECTSGMTITGEDSFTGALREVEEEIGIKINKNNGEKIFRIIRNEINIIFDIFLFKQNIDINKAILQDGEVINIKWVKKEELKEMFKKDEMSEPLNYVCELIDKKII